MVAAVRTALHQHAARKSDGVEHVEIFFERRIRRRIAAIPSVRKPVRWSEHMGMRVAGVRRRRHLRPAYLARRETGGKHPRIPRTPRPLFRPPRGTGPLFWVPRRSW